MTDFYPSESLRGYRMRTFKNTWLLFTKRLWRKCKEVTRACIFCSVGITFFIGGAILCWLSAGMYLESHRSAIEIVHPVLQVNDPRWVRGI